EEARRGRQARLHDTGGDRVYASRERRRRPLGGGRMRRGVGAWVGCAILLAGITAAQAAGHELTDEELRIEMGSNRTLASYVLRNGPPDLAEASFLADRPPWDKYEVRLYYVDMRKEISFARAWILGEPQISMVRNERPLTDEEVADLQSRARSRGAY